MHIAQFCIKNQAEDAGGQNKWSDGCPSRRRKQKWHDGERIFVNARMVGEKAAISKRTHQKGRSSGDISMVLLMLMSSGC